MSFPEDYEFDPRSESDNALLTAITEDELCREIAVLSGQDPRTEGERAAHEAIALYQNQAHLARLRAEAASLEPITIPDGPSFRHQVGMMAIRRLGSQPTRS